MNKNFKSAIFFLSFLMSLLSYSLAQAATQPTFSIIPVTPTTLQVPINNNANVIYRVTNNTKITRTLVANTIIGLNQVVTGPTSCPNPFTLQPNQSCLLTLQVKGSQLTPLGIHDIPVVCKTQGPGNNLPDLFLCSRASPLHSLNITSSGPLFAYITNGLANTVTLCNVDFQTGALFGCMDSGVDGAFSFPEGLAIRGSSIYVVNNNSANVSLCDRNSTTGLLSNCRDSGVVLNGPIDIALAGNFAFITDSFAVSSCTINSTTGLLSNCIFTLLANNAAIAINPSLPLAYVSALNSIDVCRIDQTSGALFNCVDSGVGPIFTSPQGIAINNTGTLAYITNFTAGEISICNINASGAFTSCTNSTADAGFGQSIGIKLNASNTIAYIAHPDNNTVSECAIGINGLIISCTNSGATNIFSPEYIALSN